MSNPAPEYVAARRVLLDALADAGFTPGQNPGHWVAISRVTVDLMVVPHQAGTSKASARAARLPPHDVHTARITRGLEPALLDNDRATIAALEPNDERTFELRIAGPAALLTAKAIKISERLDRNDTRPDRINEKDALDVFRILQAVDARELARGFGKHLRDHHAAVVTSQALEMYRVDGSTPRGRFVDMAANAAPNDPSVAPAFVALVKEVLAEL